MADPILARARLVAQGLITRPFATPTAAVAAFGAMQGQDLPGVIASAALRTEAGTVEDVLSAINSGALVRGYPMRGTVFFMPATDIAWITELCAGPALRAAESRRHYRDLDEADIERGREIAIEALAAGIKLCRADLFARWDQAGLDPSSGRGYHILSYLIGKGVLVYGPWNGQDQDVALAATWLPPGGDLEGRFDGDRRAATAELLRRYLTSRGPATVRDFAWWTKLPLGQVRAALPLIAGELETDGERYWRPGLMDEVAELGRAVHRPLLLPGFDEFILGYQDRLFAMSEAHHKRLVPGNNGVFKRSVVVGGEVRGVWARAGRPGRRTLGIEEFRSLGPTTRSRLDTAFEEFPFVGE